MFLNLALEPEGNMLSEGTSLQTGERMENKHKAYLLTAPLRALRDETTVSGPCWRKPTGCL